MGASPIRQIAFVSLAFAASGMLGGCPDVSQSADDAARVAPKLYTPRRTSPRDTEGVYANQVHLAWSKSAGATSYAVYFGVDPNPPLMATVVSNDFIVRELPECTKHYWRVVATNDETKEALSGPTWEFTTICR